ncbi:hypothetical protein NXS19_011700 [Fusarium pseudograminearum]|nr:hypothetical protein NXS19_011700 [Fusarium pseudograminearum]
MRQDAPYERFRRHPTAQDYDKEISLSFTRLLGQRSPHDATVPKTRVQSYDSDDSSLVKGWREEKLFAARSHPEHGVAGNLVASRIIHSWHTSACFS